MVQAVTLSEYRALSQMHKKEGSKALVPHLGSSDQLGTDIRASSVITQEVVLDKTGSWVIPEGFFKTKEATSYNLSYQGQIIGYINYGACRIEITIKNPAISIMIDKEIKTGYFAINSVGKVTLSKKIISDYMAIEADEIVCQEAIKSGFLTIKARNGFSNFKSITAREEIDIIADHHLSKGDIKSKNIIMNISRLLNNFKDIKPSQKIIITANTFKNHGKLKFKVGLELAAMHFENTYTGDVSLDSISSFNVSEFVQQGRFSIANPWHFKMRDFSNYGRTDLPLGTIVEADSLSFKRSSLFTCDKPTWQKGQDFRTASYPLTQIILNKQVVIEHGASVGLMNCLVQVTKIDLAGTLNANRVILNCDELYQSDGSVSKFEKSQIYVSKMLMAKPRAVSDFYGTSILVDQIDTAAKFTFSSSYIKSRYFFQNGGFKFDKSYGVIDELNTHFGSMTESDESKIEALKFNINGKCDLTRTSISSQRINLNGELRGQKSEIKTDYFNLDRGFIELKETQLSATKNVELLGRSELQDAVIEGHEISVGGNMRAKKSALMAKKILSTKPLSEISIDETLFSSGVTLKLAGWTTAEAKSTLRAKYITQQNTLKLFSSAIIADVTLDASPTSTILVRGGSLVKTADAKLSGNVELSKSALTTDELEFNKYVSVNNSRIEIANLLTVVQGCDIKISESEVKTDSVRNEGNLTVERSRIIANRIRNEAGRFQLCKTTVELKEELSDSADATWEINEGVSIKAKHVTLNGKTLMKKSFINASGSFWQFGTMRGSKNGIESFEVFTGQDSKTEVGRSRIKASHVTLSGETRLTKHSGVLSDAVTLAKGKTELDEKSLLQSESSIIASSDSSVRIDKESTLKAKVGMFKGSLSAYGKSSAKFDDTTILADSTEFTESQLEADKIYFTGSKQHQFNKSQIISKTTHANGAVKLADQSFLQADASWTIGRHGAVELEDSSSRVGEDFVVLGKVNFIHSAMRAKKAMIYGDLDAAKSAFTVVNRFATQSGSKTNFKDQSVVKATQLSFAGDTQAESSFLKADEELTITERFSGSKARIEAKSAELEGSLRLHESSIKAETDITLKDDLQFDSDKAYLEAGKEILVTQDARVTGKGLSLKADLLTNYGSVSTEEYLAVDVERLWNQFAVLKSNGKTKIEANKYFFNLLGHVGGANTSITAGASLNLFSDICGSDSLDINTLFALNFLGTHRSWNANINSLINLNMGLVAPLTMPSSSDAIFTQKRIASCLKMMLTSALPIYSNSINLAFTTYNMRDSIASAASAAWSGAGTLVNSVINWDFSPIKTSWNEVQKQLSSAKLKDVIPVILNVKDLAVAGMGIYNTAQQVHGEYSQHFSWDKLEKSFKSIDVDALGWKSLEHMGTVFGPMYSSASVLNLNFGCIGALNASEMDLIGMNFGTKIAGQSWIHTSKFVLNEGLYQSTLGSTTLTGSELSGGGTIIGENGLNLIFDDIHCDRGALYRGEKVYIKANEFTVAADAKAEFKKGLIDLQGTLVVDQRGSFAGQEVQFNAGNIDTQGLVHFEKSSVHTKGIIRSYQGGEFVNLNGLLTTQELIAGDYGLVKLKNDTPKDEKQTEKEKPTELTQSEPEKSETATDLPKEQHSADISGHVVVEEKGKLIAEGVSVSAQSVITHGSSSFDKSALHLKDKLTVERSGTFEGRETQLTATAIDDRGRVAFESSSIDLKEKLKVEQDGVFVAKESQFRAQGIDTQGVTHFEKSSIQLREVIQASEGGEFSSLNGTVTGMDLIAGPKGTVKLITDDPAKSEAETRPEEEKQKSDTDSSKPPAAVDLSGKLIVNETGTLIVKGLTVAAQNAVIEGSGSFDKAALHLKDKFTVEKTGTFVGHEMHLTAAAMEDRGRADFEKSSIDLERKLNVEQGGIFSAKESHFTAEGIDTQGHAHFEQSSVKVRADIHASQGGEFSSVNGSVSAKDLIAGAKGTVKLINDPPPKSEAEPKPEADKQKDVAEVSQRPADVDLMGELKVDETGTIIMQNVSVSAEKTTLNGKVDSQQVQLQTKDKLVISKTAHLKTKDTHFSSRITEYYGQADYQGTLIFNSQELITGQGSRMTFDTTSGQPGYLHLEADRGSLDGRVDADHAMVKIKKLAAVDDFVMGRGRYSQFRVTDSLGLDTDAHINLDHAILRQCGLDLSGSSIRFNTAYQTAHDIRLTSRQGDISLLKDITSRNIYSDSAAATYTSAKITATHDAYFKSKGIHYNLGGDISGDVVICEASDIRNITRGSEAFKKLAPGLKKITGSSGGIHGSEVYLTATTGNIENHGGVIEGYKFLQGLAKQNILNICNERLRKGKHDYIKEYDPAVMLGGTGLDEEQIGMYLGCDGKLINDASTIWSVGHAHIVAKGGVESMARHHTYLAGKEESSKWYGESRKKEWTESIVQKPSFGSTQGRVQILCEQGGYKGVGTDFIAKGGTDIFTRDKIALYDLKVVNTVTKKKEHAWGLSKSKRKEKHQGVFTTDFIDDGTTRLHSYEGDVVLRGVRVLGNGHFDVKAKNKIHYSASVLSHHVSEKHRGFSVSSGFLDVSKKIARGDVKGALAMDPTLSRIKGLSQSHGIIDTSKNAYDVYRNLTDTYRLFSSGIDSGQLGSAFLSHYNLGGAAGFNPSVGISYGISQSDSYYETLGPGGISRGSCSFEAGESVTLQGVPVSITGDMFVKAKDFKQIGQKLQSHSKTESYSIGTAVSATGQVGDVNASYSKSKSSSTNYHHQELHVGGRLHVDVDRWTMDAATTTAGQLTGEAREKLVMISRQDTTKSQSMSVGASSSGQMSLSMQHHSAKQVAQVTGIHVRDGINHDASHEFKVKALESTGAAITTDGVNRFQAETAIHHTLKDHSKTTGFSLSGNIVDISKVLKSDEPMKTTVKLGAESSVHKAHVQSAIHGKQGTEIKVTERQGKVHTASGDGYRVTKDSHHSLNVSVPIINQAGIKQEIEKVKTGLSKVKNAVKDVLGIKDQAEPSVEIEALSQAPVAAISVSDESSTQSHESAVLPEASLPTTETEQLELPEQELQHDAIQVSDVQASQTSQASQGSGVATAELYEDMPELIDEHDLPTAEQLRQQKQIQNVLNVSAYTTSYAADAADAYFRTQGVPVAGKIMHALSLPVTFAANVHKEQGEGNPNAIGDAFADTMSEFGVEYAIPAPVVAAARVGQWSRDMMTEAMFDPDFVNLSEDSQEVRWDCYGAACAWGAVGDALDWVEGHVADILKYRLEPPAKDKFLPEHGGAQSLIKNGIFKSKASAPSLPLFMDTVQSDSERQQAGLN